MKFAKILFSLETLVVILVLLSSLVWAGITSKNIAQVSDGTHAKIYEQKANYAALSKDYGTAKFPETVGKVIVGAKNLESGACKSSHCSTYKVPGDNASSIKVCGDGILSPGEICDTGLGGGCPDGEVCKTGCTCSPKICGNGKLDPGEGCDPELSGGCPSGKICNVSCVCVDHSDCGNGKLEPNEACDPPGGNCPEGQYCSQCSICKYSNYSECGNGHIEGSENCDPPGPGTTNGSCYFCDATCHCQGPSCGDGILIPSNEECEKGVACQDSRYDCLLSNCTCVPRRVCGDGIVKYPDEQCDKGGINGAEAVACPDLGSPPTPHTCGNDCKCTPCTCAGAPMGTIKCNHMPEQVQVCSPLDNNTCDWISTNCEANEVCSDEANQCILQQP